MAAGRGLDEEAVSEVVGTVLLIGISVVLFASLSMVVWQQMQTNPPPANAEFRLDKTEDGWTTMTLVWGESVPLGEARLLLEIDGSRQEHRMDEEPLASHLDHLSTGSPDHWDLGETLWLRCPDTAVGQCAFPMSPGASLDSVTLVDGVANAVVYSNLPGVRPGMVINPLPDLVMAADPVESPLPTGEFYAGCSFTFRATVANSGLTPTPDGTLLVVRFYLDDLLFHSASRSDPLAVGASYEVAHSYVVSATGPRVFRAWVDEDNAVAEISVSNNVATRSFTVVPGGADPGFPYVDADNDGFYNPCQGDEPLTAGDVTGGNYVTTDGKGLVIPPSTGPITVASEIHFDAAGSLVVGVDLQSTAGKVRLTAGLAARLLDGPWLNATDHIEIQGGSQANVSGATFHTPGFRVIIQSAGGPVLADDIVIPFVVGHEKVTRLELTASTFVRIERADVHVRNILRIQANGADAEGFAVRAQDANFTADPGSNLLVRAVLIEGQGHVNIERIFVRTAQDLIGIDVGSVTRTVYLHQGWLEDLSGGPNTAWLTPVCPNVNGTLARGTHLC